MNRNYENSGCRTPISGIEQYFAKITSKFNYLLIFIGFLYLSSNAQAQCPTIFIDDMQPVPGYPVLDDVSICGVPDTITYYFLNSSGQDLFNSQITLHLPYGMEFAGFYDYLDPSYPVNMGNWSDPSNPVFIMSYFGADSVQIVSFGVIPTCEYLNLPTNSPMEFDVSFDYIFDDPVLGLLSCSILDEGDFDYGPYIKAPVINITSISPATVTLTDDNEKCTTVRVSQNGIGATVTNFDFMIAGLPLAPDFALTDFSIGGAQVPYNYNPVTQTLESNVGSTFLPGGFLGEDEFVDIRICFQEQLGCATSGGVYDLTYSASFGCGESPQCAPPSIMFGTLQFAPNYGANPIINVTTLQLPAICGDNAIFEVTVTSAQTDPVKGVFNDLEVGLQLCEADAFETADVRINGVSIDPSWYYYQNFDYVVNTTLFTIDPDGPGGLDDVDGDGFFDDLPGGETLTMEIEAAIKCQDPQQINGCASIDCEFNQASVKGLRHCGTPFQALPSISPAPVFSYGSDIITMNETNIGSANAPIDGYDFGIGSTGTNTIDVEFCYQFGADGVGECMNGNSYFEFEMAGPPQIILDAQINTASVTFDGAAVPASDISWFYPDTLYGQKVFRIDAGSNDLGRDLCYSMTFELDSCLCYPKNFFTGNARVVEECFDCTPDACTIVRACHSTLLASRRNCNCTCNIQRDVVDARRTQYGFADRAMTIPLDPTTADPGDKAKFLPCDSVYYHTTWEVLNKDFVEPADYLLFQVYGYTAAGWGFMPGLHLLPDFTHANIVEFSFEKPSTPGVRTVIDFSSMDCVTGNSAYIRSSENGLDPYGFGHTIEHPVTGDFTYNSTYDVFDGNYVQIFIFDRERRGEAGSDCIRDLFDNQMGGLENGTKFHVIMEVPLQKNPYRLENADIAAKPAQTNLQFIPSMNTYQKLAGTNTLLSGSCGTWPPLEVFCPPPLESVTSYELDDCTASVEHVFKLSDNVPNDWYVNEYRPYYDFDNIEVPLISPLVYAGNPTIELPDGTIVPISDPTFDANTTCAFDGVQNYCASNAGVTGYGSFQEYEIPDLGLGLVNEHLDSFVIRYDLARICPGAINKPASFEARYQYNYGCEFVSGGYYCNYSNGFTTGLYSFFNDQIPYPVIGCPGDGSSTGAVLFTSRDYHTVLDTNYTLNFTDSSKVLPALSCTAGTNLVADNKDAPEINTYQVCAGPGAIPHMNALTTISVPNSISLDSVFNASGPFTYTLSGATATHNTYLIPLPDLNPGDCIDFEIWTELLFCPVEGADTEICITTSSSCLDLELASQLLADGGDACTAATCCYEYVVGEVGLQNTFTAPLGGINDLCSQVPVEILIKNTKVTTLVDLLFNVTLPPGLTYVPGTFEYSYPNSSGIWGPMPNPINNGYGPYGPILTLDDNAIPYVNSNGLPGILTSLDSNNIAIRFVVETLCDEYVSRSPLYLNTEAASPCETTIEAGWANHPGITIAGAIPEDNAQFLMVTDPLTYTCGGPVPVSITGLNLSQTGGVSLMSNACFTFPPELLYTPGSFVFNSPSSFTPSNVVETALPNGSMEICFDIPDGLGPQQFFSSTVELTPDAASGCAEFIYQALVKSRVENQTCVADGSTCDVFVNNTINQFNIIKIAPPVEIAEMSMVVECDEDPTEATFNYELVLEGISSTDYIGTLEYEFFRDVDLNGMIDSYDVLLYSNNTTINVPANGGMDVVTGVAVLDEAMSCPILVRSTFDVACECNSTIFPFELAPKPDFLDGLQSPLTLCPGDDLVLDICSGYNFEMIQPTSSNPVVPSGGQITIGNFPFPFGTPAMPAILEVTSTVGDCSGSWQIEIIQLEEFEIGPYSQANVCNSECTQLDLGLPFDWIGNVDVTWSPSTYLDDPNVHNPMICFPTADIVYTVTVNNPNSGCDAVATFPVNVIEVVPPTIEYDGYDDCYLEYDPAVITAMPAGMANYDFYYSLNGVNVIVQSGPNNEYILPNGVGDYFVIANDGFCNISSDTFSIDIPTCSFDLALKKELAAGQTGPFYPNTTVDFVVTVYNQGTIDAIDITVTDYIPTGLSLADTDWANIGNNQATYLIQGPLVAGDSTKITITLQIDSAGTLQNFAEISAADDADGAGYPDADSEADGDPTNDGPVSDNEVDNDNGDEDDHDVAEISADIFDLALTKALSATQINPVTIGDTVSYDIIVCNQGTIDAHNVDLVDYIPTGMSLADPNWSLAANGNAYYTVAGPVVAGTCDTTIIRLKIDAYPPSGSYDNYSEIADAEDPFGNHPEDIDSETDDDPGNDGPVDDNTTDNSNSDEDDHDIASIGVIVHDLELDKAIASSQTFPVSPGDSVTFTLTVTNNGTVPEYSIGLVDYIPTGFNLADPDWTETTPGVADLATLIPGPLAPGLMVQVDITFEIDASFQGTSITNNAEISEFDDDTDPTNDPPVDTDSTPDGDENNDGPGGEDDEDDETIPIEQTFDLALTKMLSPTQPVPISIGDTVTFVIEVCNQGTLDAHNVLVVDYLPTGMTLADPNWAVDINGNPFYQFVGPIMTDSCEQMTLAATVDSYPASGSFQNASEITSAEDADGNNPPDVDSTPDSDPNNDGPVQDDSTDNTNGDEDDHDIAIIPIVLHDLELEKSIASTQVYPISPGDTVTFALTITNAGNVPEYSIGLVDYFPADLILIDPNWTETTTGVAELNTLVPGPLDPDSTVTVNVMYVLDPAFMGTSVTNNAEISEFDDDTDPTNDPPVDYDSTPDADEGNDGPNGEDDEDDSTFPVDQIFDLALTKKLDPTQPVPVAIGDSATYIIEVCNQGTLAGYNVDVVDYIPTGMGLADANWSLDAAGNAYYTMVGPIQPDSCEDVSITLVIDSYPPSGSYQNASEISDAEDADGNHPEDVDSDPDNDNTNDGPVTDDDTDGTNDDEDDHDIEDLPVIFHDLELDKAIAPTQMFPVSPGDSVTFTLTVSNAGTVDEFNIGLVDYIPAGLNLADANWVENTPGVAELVALLPGPLAPGADTVVTITFEIDASFTGTSITNNSEISEFDDDMDPNNDPPVDTDSTPDDNEGNDGPDGEDDEDDETFEINQVFDLALTKVLSPLQPMPIAVGDTVVFDIEVCNQGTMAGYNVLVVDYIPTGMSLVDPAWVLDVNGNAFQSIAGPIMPDSCSTVSIALTVDVFPASGSLQNFSEIADAEDANGNHPPDVDSTPDSDDGNDGPVDDNSTDGSNGDEDDHDGEEIQIINHDLELDKAIASTQTFPVAPGDSVTFTLTVYNQGNVDEFSIGLVDYIPVGFNLADANWVENTPGVAELVTLIPGPLAPGDSVTMDITFEIDASFMGTSITNNAEISEFDDDMDPTNDPPKDSDSTPDDDEGNDGAAGEDDEDDETIPIGQTFDLALTKKLDPLQPVPVEVGDSVTYVIEVCNQGTLAGYNVDVVDYLPSGMSLADANWSLNTAGDAFYTLVGPILPDSCEDISITLVIDSYPSTGSYQNSAEIADAEDADGNHPPDTDSTPDDDDSNDGPVTDDDTDGTNNDEDDHDIADIPVIFHDLELDKAIASTQTFPVAPGDSITFELTVTNAGTVPEYSIGLVDYIPTGLILADANWTVNTPFVAELVTLIPGPLAPGADTTVSITFEIDASFQGTSITNNAEISEFDDDTDPTNDPPTDVDSTPDGEEGNDGPAGEDDEDDETFMIEQTFDLALTKKMSSTQQYPINIGDDVTFDIEVCNQGTLDAYNVLVIDYLPAGLILNDPDWVLAPNGNSFIQIPGPIRADSCFSVPLTTLVSVFPPGGTFVNSVEIVDAADENGNHPQDVDSNPDVNNNNDGPVTDNATDGTNGDEDDHDIEVFNVILHDLELDKAIASTQTFPVSPGDSVTFTLTVYNKGNVDEYNIGLVDYIPTGFNLADANWVENTPGIAELVALIPGALAPGDSVTMDITFEIDASFMGTSITNNAEISEFDDDNDPLNDPPVDIDSTPDGDEGNDGGAGEDDEDDATIPLNQVFDLALTKKLDPAQPVPVTMGDSVTYVIEVCNQGTLDAYNVDVIDYLPTGMSLADSLWSLDINGNAFYTMAGPIQPNTCADASITLVVDSYPPSGSYLNSAEIADAEDADGNHPPDIDSTPDGDDSNDGPITDDDTDGTNGDEDDHDIADIPVIYHDLELDKSLSPTQTIPVAPGDSITFELTVSNAGTADVYNVGLVDYTPAGLTLADPNWVENTPGVAELVTLIPGPLAPGADTTVSITFTIDATFMGNSITNNAEISEFDDDNDPTNDPPVDIDSTPDGDEGNDGPSGEDDEDDVTVPLTQVFDLALAKLLSPGQTLPITVGDDVDFDIVVCNQGTLNAYNILVVDYTPTGMSLNDNTWSLNSAGDAFKTIPGPLLPNMCDTLSITMTVDFFPASGSFTNAAEITQAEDGDGMIIPDVDSNADGDNGNDGPVSDNDMDGTNGDEDDHDIETIPVGCPPVGATIQGTDTVCLDGEIKLYTDSIADSYLWSGPNGWSDTTQYPLEIYPITLQNGGYYVLQTWVNGCVAMDSILVVVNDPQAPTLVASGDICEGDDLVLSTSSVCDSYQWIGPDGNSIPTLNNPLLNTTVGTTTIPPADSAYDAGIWMVICIDANGCKSPESPGVNININPIPTNPVALGSEICEGEQGLLTSSAISNANYYWFDGTATTVGNLVSFDQNPVINGLTAVGSPYYYWLVVNVNGCPSDTVVTTIVVHENPTVVASNNGTECVDPLDDIELYSVPSGGNPPYTFSWTGPNGFASIDQNPILPNANNNLTGTYIVTIIDSKGCEAVNSTIVDITVKPDLPVITSNAPVCEGEKVILTIQNYAGNTITYDWVGPNGPLASTHTVVIDPTDATHIGNYTVQVTVDSCTSDLSTPYYLELWPLPTAVPTNNGPLCEYDQLELMANPGTVGGPFTYSWSGPNGFTSTNENPIVPSPDVSDAGSYEVTITSNLGCTFVATTEVVINPKPLTPAITATSTSVCASDVLVLSTTPYSGVSVLYTWTDPNGGQVTTSVPSTTYSTPISGDYQVMVTVEGCNSLLSAPVTITVTAAPVAPVVAATIDACEGGVIQLGTTTLATSYLWSGPNGFSSTMANPSVITPATLADAGDYTLVVYMYGCASPASTTTVTVHPTPATPTIVTNGPICAGDDLVLSTSGQCDSYLWIGPGGSSAGTLTNPLLNTTTNTTTIPAVDSAYATGMWAVICVDANGCESPASTQEMVAINSVPNAVTPYNNGPLCDGDDLQLFAPSVPGATYLWTGPNGYTSTMPNPIILDADVNDSGSYFVYVTVNGCTSMISPATNAVVNALPAVTNLTGGGIYCEGDMVILDADQIPGGMCTWTGPNGFILTNLTDPAVVMNPVSMMDEGTYTLTIRDVNGCETPAASLYLDVTPLPLTPTITNNGPLCEGSMLELNTTPYTGLNVTYVWNTPTGSVSTAVPQLLVQNTTVADAGMYSLEVIVDGCTSLGSIMSPVQITPGVAAPTNVASNSPICNGDDIFLTSDYIQGAVYTWHGPGGFTSNAQNPIINNAANTDAGDYYVEVSVNGCSSPYSDTIAVLVNALPGVAVVSNNGPTCEGGSIDLSATGSPTATYTWYNTTTGQVVGTGNPLAMPGLTVADAGDYHVVVSENGCNSLASPPTAIVVNQVPADNAFAGLDQLLCQVTTTTLDAFAPTQGGGVWTQISGPPSTIVTPTSETSQVYGLNYGSTYEFVWTLSNATCQNYSSDTLTVEVAMQLGVPVTPTSNSPVCEGAPVYFQAPYIPNALYTWYGPNGYISTVQNPIIPSSVVVQTGSYWYTITINGCTSPPATPLYLEVVSTVVSPVASANTPVCISTDIELYATGSSTLTYEWFSSTTGQSVGFGNPFIITNATLADIDDYYVIASMGSCSSAPSLPVSVMVSDGTTPDNAYAGTDITICSDSDVSMLNAGKPIFAYGMWTQIAGPQAVIVTPSEAETMVFELSQVGTYQFVWTLSNGVCSGYSVDTVTLVKEPLPISSNDYYAIDYNAEIQGGVMVVNDASWIAGWNIELVEAAAQGNATLNSDGTFDYVAPNYVGLDSFTYKICNPSCPNVCSYSKVYITVGQDRIDECFVPNIITPNGDGVNDALTIHCLVNYPNNRIRVYNRWGDLVYNEGPYNNDWAGTYNDEDLPEGTYYYILELDPVDDPSNVMQGFVTVHR